MKQAFLITISALLLSNFLFAQDTRSLPWDIWLNPSTQNFKAIVQEGNNWYKNRDKGRGSGYKQFQRWVEFNQGRLDKDGNLANQSYIKNVAYQNELKKLRKNKTDLRRNLQGDWKEWSAKNYIRTGSWSPGIGRVNVIAYHPTDPNILFVGTPAGGLFKSTNQGDTWTALTNELSSIGVSGIAIHPSNPDIIYILTGDGDGKNTRSTGVYKTTNGGTSWSPTGLTFTINQNVYGYKLVMEPGDPTYLIAATNTGLFRTTNSGVNWTAVGPQRKFTDIEYKPGSSNVVYASASNTLYKSTNWGGSWTEKFTIPAATRVQIGVTPHNAEDVYLMSGPYQLQNSNHGFTGIYKSHDSGENFVSKANTPNVLTYRLTGNGPEHQTNYDLAIAVSRTDSSSLIVGGVNMWSSSDNGNSVNQVAHWNINEASSNSLAYVHADIHHISINPLNNRMYTGCDGGIFFSDDNGISWTDITSGLNINQIYEFDGSIERPDLMLAGMQDNGTSKMERDTMKVELGADGGDCLIHPTNPNILYAMTQYGNIRKSTNNGTSWNGIKPAILDGPFVTRWAMDKANPDTIYAGWSLSYVYRTYNGGSNWTRLTLDNNNFNVRDIAVANNSSTLYACSDTLVYKSDDRGENWTNITPNTSLDGYESVTPLPNDPNQCIITRGGFDNNVKVWIYNSNLNVSTPLIGSGNDTLPDVPVNCAAVEDNSNLVVYVGTDIGVYVWDVQNQSGWEYFKKNLPNVIVNDLYIYEDLGIIRAATFGRGIWQSDLKATCQYDLTLTPANDPDFSLPVFQYNVAADVINSTRLIIGNNGNVTYKAGDAVILKSGFLVTEGNLFRAGTKPCHIPLD